MTTARPGLDRVVVTAGRAPIATFEWCDEPDLTVVIVTYGTGAVVDRCLRSLAQVAESDGLAFEVVVVDNLHPRLGTWAGDRLCLLTDGVRLVRASDNLGFGGGNAAGIGVSRSGHICLLNPDTVLAPGQLARLFAESRARPDHIVAPGFVFDDGSVQEFGRRILVTGDTTPILSAGSDEPIDYASAACWLMTRDLFDSVGGFDPAFHPAYYEDVDFILRARGRGYGLTVVDDVQVVHTEQGSSGQRPDVRPQRARFLERWADLVATRPAR